MRSSTKLKKVNVFVNVKRRFSEITFSYVIRNNVMMVFLFVSGKLYTWEAKVVDSWLLMYSDLVSKSLIKVNRVTRMLLLWKLRLANPAAIGSCPGTFTSQLL